MSKLRAGIGGLLCALSLPPWGWWPLAIAGLALYASSFDGSGGATATTSTEYRGGGWRRRALLGAAFGLGLFLPGLWWVTDFHAVGYVLLTLVETAFFVLAAVATRGPASFAGALVLAEAARSSVPFGGLPLAGIALGQAGGPFVAAARVGGALLILGVIAAIGAALARRTRATVVIAVLAIAIAAIGWATPAGHATGTTARAALVQGGGPRGFRGVDTDPTLVFDRHVQVSERIAAGSVDLILWPENTVDVPTLRGSAEEQILADIARRARATLVAGVTSDAGSSADQFENVAVAWGPDGSIVDRYSKAHRVPFGEYVPGRRLFERVVDLSVLPRDAVAGRRAGVLRLPPPVQRAAVSISYEVFFSERARGGVRSGGRVVLVPTNAASYKTSQVPTQEVAAARLRAWETGRWILQAAPTGYSAVIDERGRVRQRSVLGRAQLLTATAPMRVGQTPYVRTGDPPVVLIALLLVALPWVRRMRGSRS